MRHLTPEEEKKMRALWRLDQDDIVSDEGGGGPYETSYKSKKTGQNLGWANPIALYYEDPYWELGGVQNEICISERCSDMDGKPVCLCVEDIIKLNDAIKDVVEKGVDKASDAAKKMIKEYAEMCPREMRRIRWGLEARPEFREFFTKGPPPTRVYKELFEIERRRNPGLTWGSFIDRRLGMPKV